MKDNEAREQVRMLRKRVDELERIALELMEKIDRHVQDRENKFRTHDS